MYLNPQQKSKTVMRKPQISSINNYVVILNE